MGQTQKTELLLGRDASAPFAELQHRTKAPARCKTKLVPPEWVELKIKILDA
ncbi:Unannotated [Lentimonas sp. CC4]|nr:Unannotated [Lentimonas sp. CC4]CAA6684088.1 Unannotated [Lentimonas sp. CC6]CAA7076536.1 Unannotated [Lentimonas sp. CC4]CAA7172103.1 Unannotated [Lentimonas sp. CC21]CAA7183067.1 Unannotated [Lentimonas sp. CC8]